MSVTYDFTDKVITITGAASGFGKLAAEKFSAAGAKVVISDINGDSVEAVAQQLRDDGHTVLATACDITRAAEVESFFALARSEFGPLDIAVNNANATNALSITQTGNTGTSVATDGAAYINNTGNTGDSQQG